LEPIQVLLADDHTLFRKGIRSILEPMPDVVVVGEAASGPEVVARARELVPDVILMDIKMPGISGIEATRQILQENPHIGIILLTMFDDPESVFSGMRAGARGYVLKEAEPEELRRAVEAAYRGEVILCPIMARKVLEHFGREPKRQQPELPYGELTQREIEVLQLAAHGLSNKEIAGKLLISEKTVKNHVANIFSKLQVNDRTQAVLYALRKGLITMSSGDSA
jgi:DNA-binding NarL/FixJ family response regulator